MGIKVCWSWLSENISWPMSVNVQRHGNSGNPKVSVTNLPPTGVGSGDVHASKKSVFLIWHLSQIVLVRAGHD